MRSTHYPTTSRRLSLVTLVAITTLIIAAAVFPLLKWQASTTAAEAPKPPAFQPVTQSPWQLGVHDRSNRHKVHVGDLQLAEQLVAQGAHVLADYGSYRLLETSTALAQSLAPGAQAEIRDDNNLILLNAGTLDTTLPEIKARRSVRSVKSVGRKDAPSKAMRLVQFVGPVQPEWYSALQKTGVTIVTYIPNNAYLVYGEAATIDRVQTWAASASYVQWDGDYRDEYKYNAASLRAATSASEKDEKAPQDQKEGGKKISSAGRIGGPQGLANQPEYSAIQLVDDPAQNTLTKNAIKTSVGETGITREYKILKYVNLTAKLPSGLTVETFAKRLASSRDVVSVERYIVPVKMDERQNQIVAGNITGNVPNTGDYLAYLGTKGITQAQFTTSNFAVNVSDSGVDNATTNPNHFALHVSGAFGSGSRVIYNRLEGTPNGGSTLQGCDGHGNINAHIIGGFVPTGTVGGVNFGMSPHADANGFRYGLGIAPFVKVGSSVIFDPGTFTNPNYPDLESRAYHDGARISSNSWGASVGGAYTTDSQAYDALVRDAQPTGAAFATAGNQEMVILFAAGNSGFGANTVGTPGTGKNVITVGASENVHPFGAADQCGTADIGADSLNDIIGFSSRGPCDDGRIKPDVVAPGTHISGGVAQQSQVAPAGTGTGDDLACFDATGVCAGPGASNFWPLSQQYYTASSGTSHSTPALAGMAALIRQQFINAGVATGASPAMTKAVMMNSSKHLTGTGANDNLFSNNQGMGLPQLNTFFDHQFGSLAGGTPSVVRDQVVGETFTATGQTRTFTGNVADNTKPFRVTLAYTDAPGSTSGNAFNNNLDLEVTVGGNTYKGNVFTGANSVTGGMADTRNNAEGVYLPAGLSGNFVVTVTATNINSDGVPNSGGTLDQDFALVIYNANQASLPVPVLASSMVTAQSCPTDGGVLVPNEDVTIDVTLNNIGTAATTALTATLQAMGGVTAPSAAQNYGAIPAGGPAVTRPFTFRIDPALVCGAPITLTFALTDGATNHGNVTVTLNTGAPNITFTENFDAVAPPALPAGWVTSFTGSGTNWLTATPNADTAPNHVNSGSVPSTVGSASFESPAIPIVTAAAQLTFRHSFNFERSSAGTKFDGGILELKIGAGAYANITTAGGTFVAGGYDAGNISGGFANPLAGEQAWSGNSGGYVTVTVTLPAAAAGQNVQFRWRQGTDNSAASGQVWRVDTISLQDGFNCPTCVPPVCTLTCPTSIVVANTSGACNAIVNYSLPTTSGTCGMVTCMPASGSTFNVGTTTVSCTSATGGGACSFTVTVTDTQAPVLSACPTVAPVSAGASCDAVVMYTPPTATDNCGTPTVTCLPASGSTFALGVTTVTCTASDSSVNSPDATCSFTVTVQDTTAPVVTPPANVTASNTTGACNAVVTYPNATVTDNCPGATVSCVPASGSTFAVGVTTVTCTGVDASPNSADGTATFTVTVQDTQAPTITCPANVNASTPTGVPIAVNYPAPTATDNCPGVVTVTCVPPSGTIFSLGTTTVTCTAADTSANSLDSNCSFTVTVTQFVPTITETLAGSFPNNQPGDVLTGTFSVPNTTTAPQTGTVTLNLPAGLIGIPGSCVVNVGTCTVTTTTVSWMGTLPPASSFTEGVAAFAQASGLMGSYQAQIANNVAQGTQLCVPANALFSGQSASSTACVTVNAPAAGPGGLPNDFNQISAQKPGSILAYPIYTSDAANAAAQNTRLAITNTNPTRLAFIHLFFVDGASCSVADSYICLTPNQTASILASDVDPGTTGYVIAIATDLTGCPINFNYLIGDEYVKFGTGHQANLGAEAIAAIAGGLPACDANSVSTQLNFNGVSYNALPRVLAASSLPSRADNNDTLLIINRLGGSLMTNASTLGTLFGILYDDAERAYSFSLPAATCQSRGSLNNDRPRLVPRYDTIIGAGRSGWLKISGGSDIGIFGAQINRNSNAASSAGAFNQGHNLHKLTLTTTQSVTIPIFPPTC